MLRKCDIPREILWRGPTNTPILKFGGGAECMFCHNYDRTVILFLTYVEKKSAVKVVIDLDKK